MPQEHNLRYRSGVTFPIPDPHSKDEVFNFTITDARNPPDDPANPGQAPLFNIAIPEGEGELSNIDPRTDEDGTYRFIWKPTSKKWKLALTSVDMGNNAFCITGVRVSKNDTGSTGTSVTEDLKRAKRQLKKAAKAKKVKLEEITRLQAVVNKLTAKLQKQETDRLHEIHQRELEDERQKRFAYRWGLSGDSKIGTFLKKVFWMLAGILVMFFLGLFIIMFAGHCGSDDPVPPVEPPEVVTPAPAVEPPTVSVLVIDGDRNQIPRHPKGTDVGVTIIDGNCNKQTPCRRRAKVKKPDPAPATPTE